MNEHKEIDTIEDFLEDKVSSFLADSYKILTESRNNKINSSSSSETFPSSGSGEIKSEALGKIENKYLLLINEIEEYFQTQTSERDLNYLYAKLIDIILKDIFKEKAVIELIEKEMIKLSVFLDPIIKKLPFFAPMSQTIDFIEDVLNFGLVSSSWIDVHYLERYYQILRNENGTIANKLRTLILKTKMSEERYFSAIKYKG